MKKTLIKNAEIVTMTGEKYKNGCILFDEKIQYGIGNGYV